MTKKFSLNSFSYKTLLTIIVFLLIGIVALVRITQKPQNLVEASWWNETWRFRRAINIDNSSGSDLTDFQVSLTLDTTDTTKFNNDCSDIRITDQNGSLLPHWIEEGNPGCGQAETKIWTKAPILPSSGTTIFVYYGNSSATNVEDGNLVFELFDNFDDNSIDTDKWFVDDDASPITTTEANQVLNKSGSYLGTTDYYSNTLRSNNSFNNFRVTELKIRINTCTSAEMLLGFKSSVGGFDLRKTSSTNKWQYYSSGWVDIANSIISAGGTFVNTKIVQESTGISVYENNNYLAKKTETINSGSSSLHLPTRIYLSPGTTCSIDIDNVRLRKYASSDPESTPQSEELSPAPIAHWKFDEGVGTTAYDSSGINHGTITGATWQTGENCISNNCLYFDSTSNNYTRSNGNILLNGDQTFSTWVYPHITSGLRGILTTHNHSSTSNIGINQNGNKFSISIGYTDGTREYNSKQSTYTITANTWTHITLIYKHNQNSVTFFINGKKDGEWTLSKQVDFRLDKILVGQWSNTYLNNYKFDGLIDEVKIYSYTRTPQQILTDYNNGLSGISTSKGSSAILGSPLGTSQLSPPITHWRLDDGFGSIAKNSGTIGPSLDINLLSPSWIEGKFGKALSFNGNGDHTGRSNIQIGTSDFSVSTWIYIRPNPPDDAYRGGIVSTGATDSFQFGINSSRSLSARCYTGATYTGWVHDSSSTLEPGRWYHVVYVANRTGTGQFFINGHLNGQSDISSRSNQNILIVPQLGRNTWYSSTITEQSLYGYLDEVKIYDYALTQDQIKLDMNQGSAFVMGSSTQNIGGTTTSLDYCIPGDTSHCDPPIAEWKFEENIGSTAFDTSGNNRHGNFGIGNSSPFWTTGHNGAAVQFDGGDSNYIRAISSMSNFIGNNTSFTAHVWFKPNTKSASLLGSGVSGGSSVSILNVNDNGTVGYTLQNGNGGWESASTSINFGQWYYASFVFDTTTSTGSLFLNGIYIDSDYFENGLRNWAYELNIGNNVWENNSYNGTIDDVRIYNYARTPAQIAYDYNHGAPIAHWKADECQGTTIHDSSGNNYHGTLNVGVGGTQVSVGTCDIPATAWGNGQNGKLNSSINFDGIDDEVNLNGKGLNNPALYGGSYGSSTSSFWIKSHESGTIANGFSQYMAGYHYFQVRDNAGNRRLRLMIGDITGGVNYWPESNSSITANEWVHVAFVIEGGVGCRFYINGKLDKNITHTGLGIQDYSAASAFGRVYNQNFNGQIDDIRIYNYPLTSEQIKIIYNNGAVSFN